MNGYTNNLHDFRVSAVIPAYNSGKYIARAIESVMSQTLSPDEIIVVDDGSTDNTAEEIRKFGPQIHYLYQENAGASVARNTAIRAAQFPWIAFLDADDEWLPEKLERQIALLQRNPELAWVTSNYIRCLCDENRQGIDVPVEQAEAMLGGKDYFEDYFTIFGKHGTGWTGTKIIRKDAIEKAGMFRPGQPFANDLDLWFRIAYLHPRIGFVSQPLAIYHMNIPQSITQTQRRVERMQRLLKKHLHIAEQFGRRQAFEACVKHMTQAWIRGLLFQNAPNEIRSLLSDFGYLLSRRFKLVIRILLIWPGMTAVSCHIISKIVRSLKLRKTITRRPKE